MQFACSFRLRGEPSRTPGSQSRCPAAIYWSLAVPGASQYHIDRLTGCWRRNTTNIDGKTAPYPPPEAAVRQGFITASAGFNLLNLWPLVIALLILLLIILTCICYKKCCAKQKARVDPEPTSGPLLASDAAAKSSTSVRSVSRMVEQNFSTDEVLVAAERTNASRDDEDRYMRQLEDAHQRALPPLPNGVHVTTKIPRLVSAKAPGGNRNGSALPPLDGRFDRPYIRMLDNVSAISLDEFWNKSDKTYANNKVPSTAARQETGRTML
uniref:Uncharacterized protein n=1 Tax=Plectus sambesii TaxID=2011161 RepID=A0A914WS94_9BILA